MIYPRRSVLLCVLTLLTSYSLLSQVYINELLADNENSISDESGDFEDWVELFNSSNQHIDVGGFYLSDDLTEPTLWQIPTDEPSVTTIPAGGFLLLWADKDISDGPLHINLKLGASGESILLTDSDGVTLLDQVDFGNQNTDISFGRSTDGASDFRNFNSPTPGTSNNVSSNIPTYSATINAEVEFVEDDAIEYGSSNQAVNINHWGMKMTQSWSNQKIGIRFRDLQIPSGAIITNAKIQFSTKKRTSGDCTLEIGGDKTDNAEAFAESDANISNRTLTQNRVNWEPADWDIEEFAGPDQQTPNLAAVVQEIVDLPTWEIGNALAFIISGTGVRSAGNFTSGNPPTLSIALEIPIPNTPIDKLYINEIAANGTDHMADNGKYTDWIEIYNDNDFEVSLGGLYLSDKADDLTKWQVTTNATIPAKGHFLIFADDDPKEGGRHASFKLSDDGETVLLTQALNNELIILDSISYGAVPFKSSVGRPNDGSNGWVLFGAPTPEAKNDVSIEWLAPPVIELESGVYNQSQLVNIKHPANGVEIYYTSDGSLPDNNQTLYTGAFSVSETQSIRAIAYKNNHAPSIIATKSYLFESNSNLPVLMISTDPDNLFDDEIGIYTVGTNGILEGNCNNNIPANFWQDWERPANLTFFEADGETAFSVDAGMKISGNCSRRYELKSLNFYLRNNQYGSNNIDYKLFPNRDFKKYDRLRLRSSGQDYRSTMLRDGTNQRMLAEVTEVEYQNYRPTLVYINGEYWGIQNFRDLYGGEYFDAHFDVKEDELDMIKSPRNANVVKEGDDIHYQNLYSFVEQNDMSIPSNYDYFQTQFDIESFLDYWISMIYMASSDWPANNLQVWREKKASGKWRYMYLDTDATTSIYGYNSPSGYLWNTLDEVTNPNQQGWPFDTKATLFFRKLATNDSFRNEYIQRSCTFMEVLLNPERAHSFIDESSAEINDEIGRHVEKYAYDNPYLEDYEDWSSNISNYKEFFELRPEYYYNHMEDFFDLDERFKLSFNYDDNTNGEIKLHSKKMEIPFGYTGEYYQNVPIRITAKADDGYKFVEWLETSITDKTIFFSSSSDFTLTPIFEAIADNCDSSSPNFEDNDGDGVCDNEDQCPGYNDNLDVNNNGIPDDCEQGCIDLDEDDVCAADDCDDNDPEIPAIPGTSCDDANNATNNDVYLDDGCTCLGVIVPTNGYCESEGNFPWHDWIQGVQINQINNVSSKSKYSDFTNLITLLEPDASYDITLTTGFSWATFDEYFRVWIDYNQDQIFSIDEIAFTGNVSAPPNGTDDAFVSGSISIPSNITEGATTRMRVAMRRGELPEPCNEFPFGEVEDYSVIFGASSTDRRILDDSNLEVWPNPTNDIVHVKIPEDVAVNSIRIIYGQGKEKVQFTEIPRSGEILSLDVSNWQEGLYFIQMEVNNSKWRFAKIVVAGKY